MTPLCFSLNKDLKANESRLRDINKVASELESEGLMAEEAPMVQAQVMLRDQQSEMNQPNICCFFIFIIIIATIYIFIQLAHLAGYQEN